MIQGYISFALNGSFKSPEINFTRPFKDTEEIAISKEEMNLILDHRTTTYNINRFYKKI